MPLPGQAIGLAGEIGGLPGQCPVEMPEAVTAMTFAFLVIGFGSPLSTAKPRGLNAVLQALFVLGQLSLLPVVKPKRLGALQQAGLVVGLNVLLAVLEEPQHLARVSLILIDLIPGAIAILQLRLANDPRAAGFLQQNIRVGQKSQQIFKPFPGACITRRGRSGGRGGVQAEQQQHNGRGGCRGGAA